MGWRDDLTSSSEAFRSVVWPVVARYCDGGELHTVEGNGGLHELLDIHGGIDAWQIIQDRQLMRGLASRVQWISVARRDYYMQGKMDTFTIRTARPSGAATELEKRIRDLADTSRGWLRPALTIQAYLSATTNELLSAAVVQTDQLIGYVVDRGVESFRQRWNGDRSSAWIAVYWEALRKKRVRVHVYRDPRATGQFLAA